MHSKKTIQKTLIPSVAETNLQWHKDVERSRIGLVRKRRKSVVVDGGAGTGGTRTVNATGGSAVYCGTVGMILALQDPFQLFVEDCKRMNGLVSKDKWMETRVWR